MSFFKKLKKDIGVEENSKSKKKVDVKKVEKEEKAKPETKKATQDWLKSEGQLAVDVYSTDSEFCVQAPIAGVTPEDLDISFENEMLIIKGERKMPDVSKEKNYFYQECYWGTFSREIILPDDADTQRIKASLQKGILTVKIPLTRKEKKKKITVVTED